MRLLVLVAAALALAAGAAAAGYFFAQRDDDEAATTVAGIPDAVARKHSQLLASAEARDYETLAELADERRFTYTFGGSVPGGPAEYWRGLESRGEADPAQMLATILRLPYTLHRGVYVWPFAFDTPAGELTAYERELLGPLGESYAGDSYLGWRAGIEPDGDWIFFVAGD